MRAAPSPSVLPPSGKDCEATEEPYAATNEAEFGAVMTRVWLLCAPPSFLGTADAGLEIRPDGRWSKLAPTPHGGLVRLRGPGNEGSWDTVDTSAMNGRPTFQINFSIDGEGWTGIVPAFAGHGSKVSKVRLDNSCVFVADYSPARPGTPISG